MQLNCTIPVHIKDIVVGRTQIAARGTRENAPGEAPGSRPGAAGSCRGSRRDVAADASHSHPAAPWLSGEEDKSSPLSNTSDDWRQKADEARAFAKLLRDPGTKKLMLTIASAYNALVQDYERGARPSKRHHRDDLEPPL